MKLKGTTKFNLTMILEIVLGLLLFIFVVYMWIKYGQFDVNIRPV